MRRWRNASRKRPASATGSGTYRKTFYWSRIATASGEQSTRPGPKRSAGARRNYSTAPRNGCNIPTTMESCGRRSGKLGEAEATVRFESRFRHKDGSYRWLSWTGVSDRDHIYAVARDITADKAAAERLKATEEALLQFAEDGSGGAIDRRYRARLQQSADGNNRIAGPVADRLNQGRTDNVARYIDAAMTSANRAAALTHRLLAFARRQPLDPKIVDADQLVVSLEDLLRRTIGETIDLAIVASNGSVVHALRSQSAGKRAAQSRHQRTRRHARWRQAHDRHRQRAARRHRTRTRRAARPATMSASA